MDKPKIIDIIGENYYGKYSKTRIACRAVIIQDNKVLISYLQRNDFSMFPGGGLEDGETLEECVSREVLEETGYIIKPIKCYLEIDEYYEDYKYLSYYFLAKVESKATQKLTEGEAYFNLIPKWININELLDIFSKHKMYYNIDEVRRGTYLREYEALKELINNGDNYVI